MEPTKPTPNTIWGIVLTTQTGSAESSEASLSTVTTLKFTELTAQEQAEYTRQHDLYLLERKEYTKQMEAMGDLRARIQTTIARKNSQYTRNCKGVPEIMAKLRAKFAPTKFLTAHAYSQMINLLSSFMWTIL